jgi:hypothetical protein
LFDHHPGEDTLKISEELAGGRQEVLFVVTLKLDNQLLVPNDELSLISDVLLSNSTFSFTASVSVMGWKTSPSAVAPESSAIL